MIPSLVQELHDDTISLRGARKIQKEKKREREREKKRKRRKVTWQKDDTK